MKRFIFLFIGVFFSCTFFSQVVNNLVVFCNDGEQFTLILNGERQNEVPQTKVRVEGLNLKKYQVRIVFQNRKMKDATPTLTFYSTCWECEFALNKHGKKKHTMDFFTQKRMEGCGEQEPNQNNNIQSNNTNTTLTSNPVNTDSNTNNLNNTNGLNNGKCLNAIGNNEFLSLRNSLLNKSTYFEKQSLASNFLQNNCFSTLQIKDLAKFFTSEQTRLDFVKKAYSKITDPHNYEQLLESFLTAALRFELAKFIGK
jgi:hypothetical protein